MPVMYPAMFLFVIIIGMVDASLTNLRRFIK